MKKYLLLITLILLSGAASAENILVAQTDYTCVNDCTQKGYQYGYCTSKCSFNDQPIVNQPVQPIQQTDYKCVSDCTAKGYQYQFCTSRCSF